ncbi:MULTISPECIES: ribonuclease P protein component 1 [Halobacterium]|uniref:ribonuclease P protein component 1 n=1 Tax=Halobacterium TaxID=2239 RepID=UPI00073F5FC2|nr:MULTISPECIES: ribonuclease P protein component 1 [Halobacterium]MCG1003957.1 ribonuclease P protein component 1 [Halobacterium noricense]
MTVTPETLPRHELVGLHARVVESTDPSRVGIEGEIVRETMRTLVFDSEEPRSSEKASGVKQVPKRGATFEFRLTDEAAASAKDAGTASQPAGGESQTTGEGAAYVTVDGVALLSRPATRSETGVDSKWR